VFRGASELAVPPAWFHVEYAVVDGKRCREHRVFSDEGSPLLAGRAYLMGRDFRVAASALDGQPRLLLRRRISFPLTGRYDLFELPSRERLGFLNRSGRFRDAHGRVVGRFRDARTLRDHLGEGAFEIAFELLLGDGQSEATGSGPTGFVLLLDGKPAGALSQARLPFYPSPPPETEPGPARRALRSVLPRRLGEALFERRPPVGWRLALASDAPPVDARLLVGAALLAIEISRW
jgi:hypothetical protein